MKELADSNELKSLFHLREQKFMLCRQENEFKKTKADGGVLASIKTNEFLAVEF